MTSSGANAEPVNESNVKVAFVRDRFLWTKINGKEEKITKKNQKGDNAKVWIKNVGGMNFLKLNNNTYLFIIIII